MRALALSILALALLSAGCAARPAAPAAHEPQGEGSPEVGSIGGIVFDDERLPIPDARLALLPLDRSTTTDRDGRFVFLDVPIGSYTLRATASGHHAAEEQVDVEAGDQLVLRLELATIPAPNAYFETDIGALHHTCMLYTLLYVSHCTAPYTTAYEALARQGFPPSQYGLPPDLAQNVYRHNFTIGPNHTAVVSELVWTANSEATEYMWFTLTCGWYDPVSDGCAPPGQGAVATFAGRRGPSPLRVEWTHPRAEWLPWVMAKARVTGDVDQYVGASVDQRLTAYNTVFYIGPPPLDWSVLNPTG